MSALANKNNTLATKSDSTKPYALEFELAGLPRTPNGSHGNWRASHAQKKQWKKKVFSKAWPHRPERPLEHARITYTRFSSSEPDFDNLAASFKPIQDGLKQAGIIADDKSANIGRPKYLWLKVARGEGRIRVRVECNQATPKQQEGM